MSGIYKDSKSDTRNKAAQSIMKWADSSQKVNIIGQKNMKKCPT